MASGRFKDISKALHATFSSPTAPRTIPDDLSKTLQAYLEKHENNDEGDAVRLQDELLDLHSKYVAKDDTKLSCFLQVLCELRPAATGYSRKAQWWNVVVQPILNGTGHRRDEIDYAGKFMLSVMDFDPDQDADGDLAKESSRLARLLLNAYMKRTRIRDASEEVHFQEDEYIAHQLEHFLAEYGRRKPRDYMNALAALVQDSKYRSQALTLLCSFVRHQPPHLHTISETPLLDNLLKCLLIDTSATSVQLALTSLIMFLPHIPATVAVSLPKLFLIYSRLLCWDRLFLNVRPNIESGEKPSENASIPTPLPSPVDASWQRLGPSPEVAETLAPNLTYYFTFLYGLYPINFTSYIRTPKEHLKDVGFDNAEDYNLVQTIISERTEQFQRGHLLHPHFFQKTRQEELQNNCWLESDPADVVAQCIGLRLEGHAALKEPGPPPNAKLPDVPEGSIRTEDIPAQSLLGGLHDDNLALSSSQAFKAQHGSIVEPVILSRKNSQRSTRTPASHSSAFSSPALRSRGPDESPLLPPAIPSIGRSIVSNHVNRSSASLHSGEDASLSEDELSTTLKQSHFHSPAARPHSPAIRPVPPPDANLFYMQREVMLLRNDLNFERYLKQQHLSHIGQLQRRHIKDATRDAEFHNLEQSNRTLRAKLTKANEGYLALKSETANDRMKNKQSESSLTLAVRRLMASEQEWRAEENNLRLDLKKAQRDCEHLRQLVVESEAKDLLSQQKVAQMEIELETVSSLRERVLELEVRVKSFESREAEFVRASGEREILKTQLATANLQLQSRDSGTSFAKRNYERRIAELEDKINELQHPEPGALGEMNPGIKTLIEHAVSASNNRLLEIRKDQASLKLRYAEMELKCQQLEQELADRAADPRQVASSWPAYASTSGPQRPPRPMELPGQAEEDAEASMSSSNGVRDVSDGTASTAEAPLSSSAPATVKHAPPRPPTVGSIGALREGSIRSVRSTGRSSRASDDSQSVRSHGDPKRASGNGFYQNSQSAFSAESIGEGGKDGKGKGVASSGSSASGKLTPSGGGRFRKDEQKKLKKIGSLRGIRGII